MQVHADQRASPRIPAKIPVVIEGRDIHQQPIQEKTETLLINEAGALIALAAEFGIHDRAKVTNETTSQAVNCRIAWRSAERIQGRWSYGIALLDSPDNFWGVKK